MMPRTLKVLLLSVIILFLLFPQSSFSQSNARLTVIVPLPDCEVIVDTINLTPGDDKTVSIKLAPGPHKVLVRLNDGTPIFRRDVVLGEGESLRLNVVDELKNKGRAVAPAAASPAQVAAGTAGSITVTVPFADCEILVGTTKLSPGSDRMATAKLDPGNYSVIVRLNEGTPIFRKDIVLGAGEDLRINIADELRNKHRPVIVVGGAQGQLVDKTQAAVTAAEGKTAAAAKPAPSKQSWRWGFILGGESTNFTTSKVTQYILTDKYPGSGAVAFDGPAMSNGALSVFYDADINGFFSYEFILPLVSSVSEYRVDDAKAPDGLHPPAVFIYNIMIKTSNYPIMANIKMKMFDFLNFGFGPNYTFWTEARETYTIYDSYTPALVGGSIPVKIDGAGGGQVFFEIVPWGTEIGYVQKNGIVYNNIVSSSGVYLQQKICF